MSLRLSRVNQDDLRVIVAMISLLAVACVIVLLSYQLDPGSKIAVVLLDRQSRAFPYPFTVQNLMHVVFALGLGEVFVRIHTARDERQQLQKRLLSQGGSGALSSNDLHSIHERVLEDGAGRDHVLHRLIHRILVQYESTGSLSDARGVLDSSVELFQHAIDLRYNLLRYLIWLLPTLGFIGTLVGISLALSESASLPDLQDTTALETWIKELTTRLGVAFNTTLVGLSLSAVLVFLNGIASGTEEQVLNDTGQYCLDNLISRLRASNAAGLS